MSDNDHSPNYFENKELQNLGDIALRIQLSAMAIASSFLLLFFPNIETITLTLFLVGYLFPISFAISICLTTVIGWEILLSMIFGFSGVTFLFKLIAWIIITFLGNFSRKLKIKRSFEFAFMGMLSALIFDLLVTISIPLLFISSFQEYLPVLLSYLIVGIPFTIAHTFGNLVLFSFIPKLLDNTLPLLKRKFSHLLKIENSSIVRSLKYKLLMFIVVILISSTLIIGAFNYNNRYRNASGKDGIYLIHLNIDYADLKAYDNFDINVTKDMTVFDITQQVAVINYTIYTSIGEQQPLIDAINGVRSNKDIPGYFWYYYIDGKLAMAGAGITHVSQNDTILWRYEPLKN